MTDARNLVAIKFLFCLSAAGAFGQSASISGSVRDPDGNVFPGAFIQLKNSQTGAAVDAGSLREGKYTIDKLAAGTYELSVNVPGMKPYNRRGIKLGPDQSLQLDVRLDDGPSLRTLGEDPGTIAQIFLNRPDPPEGPVPHMPDGKPDLSGMWLSGPASLGDAQMLPWAASLMKERAAANSKDHPATRCLPSTPVPMLGAGFFKIVQAPTTIVMMFEYDTPGYRQVFLDGREHPKDFGPTWLGHSTGRWDGETLVIDSVGFNENGWLDFDGHPHTEKLHVIQKLRRADLGQLEIEITVDDAGALQKTWTGKKSASLAPDEEVREYICNENNVDGKHMVGN